MAGATPGPRHFAFAWAFAFACAAPLQPGPGAEGPLVPLARFAPDVEQDMRYAGSDNFLGRPADGYEAPVCLLTEPAARALKGAQAALAARGLGLRVFDCYRPARAVADFVRWAEDEGAQESRARYYPFVAKADLLAKGYIARTSSHSRGSTVDATLVRPGPDGTPLPLDMGTPFDFFDPRSATASREVAAEARAHRLLLRDVMEAAGFRNYPAEWWHYTLEGEPFPERGFDVPVR